MAGDTSSKPTASTVRCPACGGQVRLTALGQTVTLYCSHCSSELDTSQETVQLVQRATEKETVKPMLPLGTRGTLQGTVWEVIGFMQRSASGYAWGEYLLFNPAAGYRWLVENRGHWTLYRTINQNPGNGYDSNGRTATLQNKDYKIFDHSQVKVDYVVGEFYWRVRKGDRSEVDDYIRPPYLLSREMVKVGRRSDGEPGSGEQIWTLGEYIPHTTVQTAFKTTSYFRWPLGVGANQPNGYYNIGKELLFYGIIFSMLLGILIVGIGALRSAPLRQLLQETYSGIDEKGSLTSQISPGFTLEQTYNRLDFEMEANVNNNWAELQIDLVNEDTGQITHLEQGVERWSGKDRDGNWTEGGTRSQRKLVRLPPGHYHLDVDYLWSKTPDTAIRGLNVTHSIQRTAPLKATLTVTQGQSTSLHFWLGMTLLLAPALFALFAGHVFETQRWSDSPYNPYEVE